MNTRLTADECARRYLETCGITESDSAYESKLRRLTDHFSVAIASAYYVLNASQVTKTVTSGDKNCHSHETPRIKPIEPETMFDGSDSDGKR